MAGKQNNINEVIERAIIYLKQFFNIKEVILFGSQISGEADQESDIDLAVISPDFKNKSHEEILDVFARLALTCGTSVEIHPYTEEDVKNARPTNLIGSILRNGKVVFK